MLDYSFHYAESARLFINTVEVYKLSYRTQNDPIDNDSIVSVEEPIADDIWDKLDELYDDLEIKERHRLEAESTDGQSTTALYIELNGGKKTIASVDPDIVNRILTVVSITELNDFIHCIAESVENPDDRSLCKRD